MKKLINVLLSMVLMVGIVSVVHADAADYAIQPQFEAARGFSEGFAAVKQEGKWGYINKQGNVVIQFQYDNVMEFHDGLASVENKGKHGYINKSGEEIVKVQYDSVNAFHDGLASVNLSGKYGVVDKTGKEVVTPQYDKHIYFSSDGLARIQKDQRDGFINKTGTEVLKPQYRSAEFFGASSFSEGLAPVTDASSKDWWKISFIDKTGEVIIPPKYESTEGFYEGLAAVSIRVKGVDSWGYIDKTGYEVVNLRYDSAYDFSGGVAIVGLDGKYGLIDKTGEEIVPLQYDRIYSFNEGMAAVIKDNKVGFINNTGKEVVAPQYFYDDYYRPEYKFINGFAKVALDKERKYGYIDKTGKVAVKFEFKDLGPVNEGLLAVKRDYNSGFIDKAGNEIVKLKYAEVGYYSEGLAAVKIDGKWGYITNPLTEKVTAAPTSSTVLINGKKVAFEAYNIKSSNYFKLRDIAMSIAGTDKKFSVGWDGADNAISLTSGKVYNPAGGELVVAVKPTAKNAKITTSKVLLNGKEVDLTAYKLGENNYFKLRDIAKVINFEVAWDASANLITIDTSKVYKESEKQ